jgi:hypothetical protein
LAAFFIIGEKKVRPGVYFRYENWGLPPIAGVDDGKCAAVFRSNWGPVGQAVPIENYEAIARTFGDGGPNGTTAVPLEQFRGGARLVFAIRLGDGGAQGVYQIKDIEGTSVIRLTLKYPGSRAFLLTIRPTLDDPNLSELLLLEDTTRLERVTFSTVDSDGNPLNQVDALINAVTESGGSYFNLLKLTDSKEPLAAVDQAAIPPGTDPSTNVAAYSAAFEVLEAYRWNVLSIDTTDTGVQMMMQMYLDRIYNAGKWVMGVIGESKSVPFETRLRRASAFNDYQIIYVGTGFVDIAGNVYDGWLAAARIAGLIAGTPSNESITHLAVSGAVDLTEPLTNYMYERSILAGMLTFSTSAANTVWVEQGINTLVLPGTKEDEGWKKIKRTKIRFELMQRLNDTVEPLVGRVNNDPDGRMTIIQSSNAVCNAMVAERKLLTGAHCEIDPDNAPKGDSAWFLVFADDIDALEKLYFTFKFRFAPDELTS